MNYYQKHIGDFNNKTRHLTRVERSLYQDAIELYYSTEKPLITDIEKLARLLLANTEEEINALGVVLDEFFVLTDIGYFNNRCNKEIEKYQGYIENQSKAGKASAKQRVNKGSTPVEPSLNHRSTNHKPLTNNQEPITNKNTTPLARLVSLKINNQIAKDWIALRNKQKAPVTETVIKSFLKKAEKAKMTLEQVLVKCIDKSWRGFEPEWLVDQGDGGQPAGTNSDWQLTKNGIREKGSELGIPMNIGEPIQDYRRRLMEKENAISTRT